MADIINFENRKKKNEKIDDGLDDYNTWDNPVDRFLYQHYLEMSEDEWAEFTGGIVSPGAYAQHCSYETQQKILAYWTLVKDLNPEQS